MTPRHPPVPLAPSLWTAPAKPPRNSTSHALMEREVGSIRLRQPVAEFDSFKKKIEFIHSRRFPTQFEKLVLEKGHLIALRSHRFRKYSTFQSRHTHCFYIELVSMASFGNWEVFFKWKKCLFFRTLTPFWKETTSRGRRASRQSVATRVSWGKRPLGSPCEGKAKLFGMGGFDYLFSQICWEVLRTSSTACES